MDGWLTFWRRVVCGAMITTTPLIAGAESPLFDSTGVQMEKEQQSYLRRALRDALLELARAELEITEQINKTGKAGHGKIPGGASGRSSTPTSQTLPAVVPIGSSAGNGASPGTSTRRPSTVGRERHLAAQTRAIVLLDSVILGTIWGGEELDRLTREYPGSFLLRRYEAALAAQQGRDSIALTRYEQLLRVDPQDLQIHLARGNLFLRNNKMLHAVLAYERAFELDPAKHTTYETLRDLHDQLGTMTELLSQIRRMRVRKPELVVLRDHEIELLHRLGRLQEAAAVAEEKPL